MPNLQTFLSTLSYFDSVSHFFSRADLDSSINSFCCTKSTSMPHASYTSPVMGLPSKISNSESKPISSETTMRRYPVGAFKAKQDLDIGER